MVNAYFDKKRGVVVGVVTCGSGIGLLIMAFLIEEMIGSYGWRGCYLIVAAFFLHLCVCASVLRPLESADCDSDQDSLQADTDRDVHESSFDQSLSLSTDVESENIHRSKPNNVVNDKAETNENCTRKVSDHMHYNNCNDGEEINTNEICNSYDMLSTSQRIDGEGSGQYWVCDISHYMLSPSQTPCSNFVSNDDFEDDDYDKDDDGDDGRKFEETGLLQSTPFDNNIVTRDMCNVCAGPIKNSTTLPEHIHKLMKGSRTTSIGTVIGEDEIGSDKRKRKIDRENERHSGSTSIVSSTILSRNNFDTTGKLSPLDLNSQKLEENAMPFRFINSDADTNYHPSENSLKTKSPEFSIILHQMSDFDDNAALTNIRASLIDGKESNLSNRLPILLHHSPLLKTKNQRHRCISENEVTSLTKNTVLDDVLFHKAHHNSSPKLLQSLHRKHSRSMLLLNQPPQVLTSSCLSLTSEISRYLFHDKVYNKKR